MTLASEHLHRMSKELFNRLPVNLPLQTVELIVVLTIYIGFRKTTIFQDMSKFGSMTELEFIIYEIQEISETSEELHSLIVKPLRVISNNQTLIDEFINGEKLDAVAEKAIFLQKCFERIEYKQLDSPTFKTPIEVVKLISSINKLVSSSFILNLNANNGEICEDMNEKGEGNNATGATYNISYSPLNYLSCELRKRLYDAKNHMNLLNEPYELKLSGLPKFDFVFSNPPFGKSKFTPYPNERLSNVAMFLDAAIKATKRQGKITFIVPVGFLFGKEGKNGDYSLRKKLIEEKAISAIIELPDSTFMPYAKIKTAILIIDYARQRNNLTFIHLTSDDLKSTSTTNEQILKLLNGSIEPSSNKVTHTEASYLDVISKDFDWQIQSYLHINEPSLRPIEAIQSEIKLIELELQETRSAIQEVLAKMGHS